MKKNYILIGLFSLLGSGLFAQNDWCGFDEQFNKAAEADPTLLQRRIDNEWKIREWIDAHPRTNEKGVGAPTFIVPVVFHIMNDEEDTGDLVTEAQLATAMKTLNEDFRRNNADTINTRALFQPYAADIGVEFRMATIDPNGECTNGITKHNTALTNDVNSVTNTIKGVEGAYWDANKYFNIWIVKSILLFQGGRGTILGYAQFPGTGSLNTYGIVMIDEQIRNSNNRTLTHEVGHCFNLFHTHHLGCAGACATTGDRCCDTPQESEASFQQNCTDTINDCSENGGTGLDSGLGPNPFNPTENYMSYDECQNMFTLDQKDRVLAAIATNSFLTSLVSTSNLVAAGVDDGYVPVICADFSIVNNQKITCASSSVEFKDESFGTIPTSWSWNFGNGDTSSTQDPLYTYPEAGTYSVTLVAGDGTGTETTTKQNIIIVEPIVGGLIAPFFENFESPSFPVITDPLKQWEVVNGSAAKWAYTNVVSASGSGSYSLPLKSISSDQVYELISPSIDFSSATCTKLRFKYAYSKKFSTSKDVLSVYVSKNCGEKWDVILQIPAAAGNLSTSGELLSSTFIPTQDQWKQEEVSLSAYTGRDHILVKIEVLTGGGNFLYLDDIDVGCDPLTGIEELSNVSLDVYPNPFENDANIAISLLQSENISIQLFDLLGKEIYSKSTFLSKGKHQLKISELSNLEKGVYFVTISDGVKSISEKIIKY